MQAQLYTILQMCRAFDRIFKEHLDGGYVNYWLYDFHICISDLLLNKKLSYIDKIFDMMPTITGFNVDSYFTRC